MKAQISDAILPRISHGALLPYMPSVDKILAAFPPYFEFSQMRLFHGCTYTAMLMSFCCFAP